MYCTMHTDISELFITADVCVARYLSYSLQQTYVLSISELFTTTDVCVARYLSCSLKQTYVLRDI